VFNNPICDMLQGKWMAVLTSSPRRLLYQAFWYGPCFGPLILKRPALEEKDFPE
jgi:hypothetical protein